MFPEKHYTCSRLVLYLIIRMLSPDIRQLRIRPMALLQRIREKCIRAMPMLQARYVNFAYEHPNKTAMAIYRFVLPSLRIAA